MITEIYVDGFRSLSKFDLCIRPGLNMLVGPNGSGKTNIILFFELLSKICTAPLSEAISNCGGAGSIFRRSSTDNMPNTFSAEITGKTKNPKSKKKNYTYKYYFTISLSTTRDDIYFSNQRIKISSKSEKNITSIELDIESNTDEKDNTITKIHKIDLRKQKITDRKYIFSEKLNDTLSSPENTKNFKLKELERHISENYDPEHNYLLNLFRLIPEARAILFDMIGGEAFNVIPTIAKEPEDSTTPPGVSKDGSGLAATLYALKKANDAEKAGKPARIKRMRPLLMPFWASIGPRNRIRIRPKVFTEIQELTSVVNEQVKSLDVKLNQEDNKFHIEVNMSGNDSECEGISLPFSYMSDGTVKWISLVTAILTNPSILAIEEPENFIHPLMQREIVDLMRNSHSENSRSESFIILTTHSETLLNAAYPEEVIVVSMVNGKTNAVRPSNIEGIRKEMSETGFGLGHFYLTGALDDA